MGARIAVVGGGIFGCTAATRLAEDGHSVTLHERQPRLLMAASGINQYRLYRGYHYPRCLDTARASLRGEPAFVRRYGDAVVDYHEHFFAIASERSKVNGAQYLDFLDVAGLSYRAEWPDFLAREKLDVAVRVEERLFDPVRLREIAVEELSAAGVRVLLERSATVADLDDFDYVVVATYARINDALRGFTGPKHDYQFEVCEKPVVRPPPSLKGKSIVIMDGPFMCIDPLGDGELSVMGNVVHAIHHTNVGQHAEVPDELAPVLDAGVVPNPPRTRFELFRDSAAEFIPDCRAVEHVGSMFTVRTVLPNTDATDTRPTLVRRVSDRVITLFSGKIGTCVTAAEQVAQLLHSDALD